MLYFYVTTGIRMKGCKDSIIIMYCIISGVVINAADATSYDFK